MDFGELKNDTNLITRVTNISAALDKIEESLKTAVEYKNYDELSLKERTDFDLFLSYAVNSLFWMYVKLQGNDPNSHGIKNELSRIRQAMMRHKEIQDRKTMPRLDKGAAGRFIKHGLHHRDKKKDEEEVSESPKNKKTRFNDSDEE